MLAGCVMGIKNNFKKNLRYKICLVTATKERFAFLLPLAPSLGCTWLALEGRALGWGTLEGPLPSHLFVYLFPNLPALSFNRLFLTQPRASQLGSVLGGISPAVASAQPRFCGLCRVGTAGLAGSQTQRAWWEGRAPGLCWRLFSTIL